MYHWVLWGTPVYHLVLSEPQATTVYHGIPHGTMGYCNVPQCTTVYHWVSRGTTMYHSVPQNTAQYHGVPQCITRYHSVPLGTTVYHSVPHCTKMYHRVPLCTMARDSTMVPGSSYLIHYLFPDKLKVLSLAKQLFNTRTHLFSFR